MLNSIFMLSKYLKKTVTTVLILGLMISPILPAAQSISSSISIASQAAEVEVQLDEAQAEEAQAATGYWSEYTNTDWYDKNKNEYSIRTAEELAGLAKLVNDGTCDFEGKTIKLTDNIDLGEHYWVPIGDGDYSFQGTFDGQGRKIKNMKIGEENNPTELEYVGLFGRIEYALINNLTIDESCCIYTASNYTAAICAESTKSIIYKCHNKGNIFLIRNQDNLGKYIYHVNFAGIVAKINNSIILECSNEGEISSEKMEIPDINTDEHLYFNIRGGGINASCVDSLIIGCTNKGNLKCKYGLYVAGICAVTSHSRSQTQIINCKNTGNIEARLNSAGICCNQSGAAIISTCINDGNISGELAGGIVSMNTNESYEDFRIQYCVNNGDVSGNARAGGIIARCDDGNVTVDHCSNSGKIHGGILSGGIIGNVGGDGYHTCKTHLISCLNNGAISGDKTVGGIIGSYSLFTGTIIKLEECYSAGEISGEAGKEGELIGYHNSSIEDNPRIKKTAKITKCGYFSDRITAIGNETDPEGVEKLEGKEVVDQKIEEFKSTNNNQDTDGFLKTPAEKPLKLYLQDGEAFQIYFTNGEKIQKLFYPCIAKDLNTGEETLEYFYVDSQVGIVDYTGWITVNGEHYYLTSGKMEINKWATAKRYEDGRVLAYVVGNDGRKINNVYAIVSDDEEHTYKIYNTEERTCKYYQNGKLVKVESVDDESLDDESLDDESVDDESVDDESLDDESVDDESADDESVDDESADDE